MLPVVLALILPNHPFTCCFLGGNQQEANQPASRTQCPSRIFPLSGQQNESLQCVLKLVCVGPSSKKKKKGILEGH